MLLPIERQMLRIARGGNWRALRDEVANKKRITREDYQAVMEAALPLMKEAKAAFEKFLSKAEIRGNPIQGKWQTLQDREGELDYTMRPDSWKSKNDIYDVENTSYWFDGRSKVNVSIDLEDVLVTVDRGAIWYNNRGLLDEWPQILREFEDWLEMQQGMPSYQRFLRSAVAWQENWSVASKKKMWEVAQEAKSGKTDKSVLTMLGEVQERTVAGLPKQGGKVVLYRHSLGPWKPSNYIESYTTSKSPLMGLPSDRTYEVLVDPKKVWFSYEHASETDWWPKTTRGGESEILVLPGKHEYREL